MVLREKRTAPAARFVQNGVARSDEMLDLRIALKNSNMYGLGAALLDAATPGRPNFRHWLSKQEVASYARPSNETLKAVTDWLSKNGLAARDLSPAGDWLSISVPVGTANKMLNATFTPYLHSDTGARVLRTLEYSLPEAVAPHVRLIHPTTSFPVARRRGPQGSARARGRLTPRVVADANCEDLITPICVQELYNLPQRVSNPASASQIAVSGYVSTSVPTSDLSGFLAQFRPDLPPNTTFTFTSLDGGLDDQDPAGAGDEANLDVQYAMAVSGGLPTVFVSVGEQSQDGDLGGFLDTVNLLLAQDAPPPTFTTSYGFNHEDDISSDLTLALCDAYQQLTARGVSILFASGDGGVSGGQDDPTCAGEKFIAAWPACPWVTMVGATQGVNPEQGADLSAGGFSYLFDAPAYQTAAVSEYLDQLQDPRFAALQGLFNPTGRAYPDVAAQGVSISIVNNTAFSRVDGTSASSPMFAAIVAMLNDELLSAGQPPLGFLNPWMYANPQIFNDIVGGSNPGCGTAGFPALPGWDPVTGLGTPNYPLMRAAAGLARSSLVGTGFQALLGAVTQ
ncbi:subtilisin-like protein [Auricularia subglabra TFB-10046 SS5]|nr:subtilisin-like protein [Auricularia subglabra TFB-10046 SS5]